MYDLPQNYKLHDIIKDKRKIDVNTYKGKLKNMVIWHNLNCLTVFGSLAKYLNDENMTPLNRKEVKQAIKRLEKNIGLSLKSAIVSSVEFGTSIITNEKPFEYLDLFWYTKRLARVKTTKWTGVETVLYTTPTGSFEFCGYDKVKEMLDNNKEIPLLFNGANVLRLEYKIRKRKGIQAKFNDNDLTAYSLFDENVYKKFQELFLDAYKDIDKMGRLVYGDKSENITPLKVLNLQAEQYRQSFPKDYRYNIQQLIEAGKLFPKSLERIRAKNHKLGNDFSISDQSILIEELDALVYDMMMFGD